MRATRSWGHGHRGSPGSAQQSSSCDCPTSPQYLEAIADKSLWRSHIYCTILVTSVACSTRLGNSPRRIVATTIIAKPTDNGREEESVTAPVGSSMYMVLMTMK